MPSFYFVSYKFTKGFFMTRILQIRRGTATQNDNFTGLNGEITMDTTNKTIRIHDGETLGGIKLARQDEIPSSESDFDINSVSSSFWTTLFATYQTGILNREESALFSIYSDAYFDYQTQLNTLPKFSEAVLVCQSADAGYSENEEVKIFGIGDYLNTGVHAYIKNDYLFLRLFIANKPFWVFHKTSASKTNIDTAKWKIKFIVYY